MLCNQGEFSIFPITYCSSFSHFLTVLTKLIGLIPQEEHSYIIDTMSFSGTACNDQSNGLLGESRLSAPSSFSVLSEYKTQESGYHSLMVTILPWQLFWANPNCTVTFCSRRKSQQPAVNSLPFMPKLHISNGYTLPLVTSVLLLTCANASCCLDHFQHYSLA